MQVEGGRLDAAELQLTEDGDGGVGPDAARGGAVLAIEGEGFGEEFAGKAVEIVGAGGDGGVGFEGDGHGENEAAGVVGMLAEEVNASGGHALDGLGGGGCSGLRRGVAEGWQECSSPLS